MTGVDAVPEPVVAHSFDAAARDEAIEALFRESYGSLVGLARLLLDDGGQAEEVVQEAFAKTYGRWAWIRDRHDPLRYVRRTVVNLARGGIRCRMTARRHAEAQPADALSAEAEVVEAEDEAHLAAAVRRLPQRQRECVVLRFYLDASTADTAAALDISEGAVKTHLHRALAALGHHVEDIR